MYALDQVGVLAHIERAFRARQKFFDVAIDVVRRFQVARIAELRVSEGVDAHVLRLKQHDFFEMRMFPIGVRRVLVDAVPYGID